jgi:fluoride exporter
VRSAAPASRAHHPFAISTLFAVGLGGALGTVLRAGIEATLLEPPVQFATATLLANVAGAALLGILVGRASPHVPEWARAGLGAGLLGSFTTYSAFAVSVVLLAEGGRLAGAVVSVLLTLVLGIGAAAAGHALGARLARKSLSAPAPWPEADE